MSADLQSSGKWPSRKDLLTRNEIEGANSNAHDFKITGEILSGPGDLFVLRDLRCLRGSGLSRWFFSSWGRRFYLMICVVSAGVDCVGDLVPVRIKKGIRRENNQQRSQEILHFLFSVIPSRLPLPLSMTATQATWTPKGTDEAIKNIYISMASSLSNGISPGSCLQRWLIN